MQNVNIHYHYYYYSLLAVSKGCSLAARANVGPNESSSLETKGRTCMLTFKWIVAQFNILFYSFRSFQLRFYRPRNRVKRCVHGWTFRVASPWITKRFRPFAEPFDQFTEKNRLKRMIHLENGNRLISVGKLDPFLWNGSFAQFI